MRATSSIDTRTERIIQGKHGQTDAWTYYVCDRTPSVYGSEFRLYHGSGTGTHY